MPRGRNRQGALEVRASLAKWEGLVMVVSKDRHRSAEDNARRSDAEGGKDRV
jgi:hypothetical protein